MRILIVEDERKIARALKRALEAEKYAVDISFDGDDGFSMATAIDYDLMIFDRMIPGEHNGVRLTKELRKIGNKTPILMLTALAETNNKTEGLDAGADDYLTKPFALEELLARVRALLRRPKTSANTRLSVGDLTLDLNSHQVIRGGNLIELTRKEFQLLEYLMRSSPIAVSKDQIITHVWDFDSDILPNNVEVHIGFLRNKIDKNHHKKLIKTVRGVGYKIDEK